MNKLAKVLISFGTGYVVGKMVEGTHKKEVKDLKPLKIDVGDLKNMFEDMKNLELESGKDRLCFKDGKQIVRSETDTRILETIIGVDGMEFKNISKIDEMKKEIEGLKRVINTHGRDISKLDSGIKEVAARMWYIEEENG